MPGKVVYPPGRSPLNQSVLALVCGLMLTFTFGRSPEHLSSVANVRATAETRSEAETQSEAETACGQSAVRVTHENREDRELALSRRVYRHGSILVVPHTVEREIDAVAVYRGKNLILLKSLSQDFTDGDFMWLSFPYTGNPAKSVRSFDGDLSNYIADDMISSSTPFADFDGDGFPELVLSHNSGNASDVYNIYSLRGKTKELGTIEAVRSIALFMDVDQDGKYEVLVRDSTFFGWKTCNAYSPMPLVVLKMEKKKFKLATRLMQTQPPSIERQRKMLSDWNKACKQADLRQAGLAEDCDNKTFWLAPLVWGDMLSLIYSGNSNVAFSLLDEFWAKDTFAENMEYSESIPTVRTSKMRFERMFLDQLRCSPYLHEIKRLNRGDSRVCNLQYSKT